MPFIAAITHAIRHPLLAVADAADRPDPADLKWAGITPAQWADQLDARAAGEAACMISAADCRA